MEKKNSGNTGIKTFYCALFDQLYEKRNGNVIRITMEFFISFFEKNSETCENHHENELAIQL